jgi:hypothetical protein
MTRLRRRHHPEQVVQQRRDANAILNAGVSSLVTIQMSLTIVSTHARSLQTENGEPSR